ncbi:uncharacterized protein MELLADRAFT_102886 [Melampsora larici-populina 98AG31]|uniref:Uncharacterized protein n=1 Tax=Melampsora larici-populina (strain 98AG31 / pathotype 3-4-7) TaxID=747676 RepID=F4R9Q0_MELLP|nr:uncharacterized protein MELLADRAFT_102886 [Melampsora larici-populina 98AG31]EGG11018.1 hypothetical protein MELLADRAFT_102886 [Melampsora larici-populina 98AG31]
MTSSYRKANCQTPQKIYILIIPSFTIQFELFKSFSTTGTPHLDIGSRQLCAHKNKFLLIALLAFFQKQHMMSLPSDSKSLPCNSVPLARKSQVAPEPLEQGPSSTASYNPPPPLYAPGYVGSTPGYQHTAIVPHDCTHVHSLVREWLTRNRAKEVHRSSDERQSNRPSLKRKAISNEDEKARVQKAHVDHKQDLKKSSSKALYPTESSFGSLSNSNLPGPRSFYAHRLAHAENKIRRNINPNSEARQ